MKKDNKKALYESIMTSVAKEVKKALNEGCKDLNISKFDLEKIKEEQMQDKNVLEYLHNILFEVEIEEGNLVCANCGREYMIKRGIPDMVLKDDEI